MPLLPTTTIGSFPQTQEIRKQRAAHKKGAISDAEYNEFLKQKTEECVRQQEQIGLDVLVHGEFERNDMVEYFGEHLAGFAFTANGWVQSYGSRCVKPPIIYGDVSRRSSDHGRVEQLRQLADRAADEGNADRADHDSAVVVRSQRHSGERCCVATGAGAARGGAGPGGGGHPHHSGG